LDQDVPLHKGNGAHRFVEDVLCLLHFIADTY
jgi:hypothetical protein